MMVRTNVVTIWDFLYELSAMQISISNLVIDV